MKTNAIVSSLVLSVVLAACGGGGGGGNQSASVPLGIGPLSPLILERYERLDLVCKMNINVVRQGPFRGSRDVVRDVEDLRWNLLKGELRPVETLQVSAYGVTATATLSFSPMTVAPTGMVSDGQYTYMLANTPMIPIQIDFTHAFNSPNGQAVLARDLARIDLTEGPARMVYQRRAVAGYNRNAMELRSTMNCKLETGRRHQFKRDFQQRSKRSGDPSPVPVPMEKLIQ